MSDHFLALDRAAGDVTGDIYDAGGYCRGVAFSASGEPDAGGRLTVAEFRIEASWDPDPDGDWYVLYRQQEPSVVRNTPDNRHDRHFSMMLTPDRHHPHVSRYFRAAAEGIVGTLTVRLLAFDPVATTGP